MKKDQIQQRNRKVGTKTGRKSMAKEENGGGFKREQPPTNGAVESTVMATKMEMSEAEFSNVRSIGNKHRIIKLKYSANCD
jgi:hypothetical protein